MKPTVSVIVNTWNRAEMLRQVLKSFRWLRYDGPFEVIVVNGPSTDNTEEVLNEFRDTIRVADCARANLSESRNIGIRMATGEFVVFIDDDAYPEPEWLDQMLAPFDSPTVAAVGGIVYDHTGYSYQYEYRTASRLLNCNWAAKNNAEHLCFPYSFEFPYPPGGNAAYRRSALIEVGGFDEEIEYYGDETDVALRLVDAGYLIRNIVGGYIHHKSAPSNIRNNQRVVKNWYPILKNKMYFAIKNGRNHLTLPKILDDNKAFCTGWENDVRFKVDSGLLTQDDLSEFEAQQGRAWERALTRGLATDPKLLDKTTSGPEGDFLRFETSGNTDRSAVVLISQHYPPTQEGGIPTLTKELGEALAAEGRMVHVVTQSPDINRVDLENGVWVHRVLNIEHPLSSAAKKLSVPQRIWNWSATARAEVERIATHRDIAVVEAPIWDCQGVAFITNPAWPLVTSLMTTLHFWLESHPELRSDSRWMADFGTPMLKLEKEVMQKSDGVRSISAAIRREIEHAYDFRFDDEHILVSPLGMAPIDSDSAAPSGEGDGNKVLFVGRLEDRKGIDVLLNAIPKVLARHPNARFRILGDDSILASGSEKTYKEIFLASAEGRRSSGQVSFEGRVDTATLLDAYRWCDLFVAPSRFESFGLVFLEAMREGKPVIGCLAGGMPEVVADRVNGVLIEPGHIDALVQAICEMLDRPEQRISMGASGRALFQRDFSAAKMAERSQPLYELAARNYGALAA